MAHELTALGGMVHPTAIGADTETFKFDRGWMAPTIVCVQWGTTDGEHAVAVTRDARDALAWILSREHEQIWWHNGPYDGAAILATYPELAHLVWQALDDGRWFDTMYLERMSQIARGLIGGPLALDMVALQYGLPPPTKAIMAPHPDEQGGELYDVRTSFHLWYGADAIPDPWHAYADYDGIIMLPLAKRQTERWCTGQSPAVRLSDLAAVTRTYFGLNLTRVYGLAVDPRNTEALDRAARNAIGRLQEVAIHNGFLRPAIATRAETLAGLTAGAVCTVRDSEPPKAKKGATPEQRERQLARHATKVAQHADCPGCKMQATLGAMRRRKAIADAKKAAKAAGTAPVLPDEEEDLADFGADTDPAWCLDTKALTAAIVKAYDGKPPLTEPKKGKDGKRTGGGTVARSRDVLQDSGNADLEAFSEFNEFRIVLNKDLKMFEQSPVHQNIGITNNLRPSSSNPNVLNLRRNSFVIATCPNAECGYETSLDLKEYKKGAVLPCPVCGT